MKKIFKRIKNNSLWEMDNNIYVVYKTKWFYNFTFYPVIYYYQLQTDNNIKQLYCMNRADFLTYATKYNEEII